MLSITFLTHHDVTKTDFAGRFLPRVRRSGYKITDWFYSKCVVIRQASTVSIGGLQPIHRDPKENGVAAMLDDRTFCFVIQHGRHTIVFLDLQGLVANHLQA